ncbi:MAG: hypothetical protein HRU04_07015 [Oceanospirillaceae bacterium]|nr:hypothetical protein [Oceanospirillaceae bacterium]
MTTQKKMSIDEYISREFVEGAGPGRRTIVSLIKKGIVPGISIGWKYWVYEQITVADELINSVLRKVS